MRKITQLAAGAFARGERFNRDNTTVTVDGEDVCLALHGHIIARRRLYRGLAMQVSMCGWATPTTRERLDAALPVGLRIAQRKGQQVWCGRGWWAAHDGKPVDPSATYRLNTEDATITEVQNG